MLVIKDPKHPENEGQVKLFQFGKKIFDMITDKVSPSFEEDEAVDVFGIDDGANFKIRMRKVDGYASFDKSEFSAPSALCDGDDDEILKVLNAQHWLGEFVALDKFKPYDVLKKRFDEIMNGSATPSTAANDVKEQTKTAPAPQEKLPVKEVKQPETKKAVAPKTAAVVEDSDDDLDLFKKSVFGEDSDEDVPF